MPLLFRVLLSAAVFLFSARGSLPPKSDECQPLIPRLVFKTGRYASEYAFPQGLQNIFRANRFQNPRHRFVYVNDSQLEAALSRTEFGDDAVALMRSLRPGAYRADLGRMALLWECGGIYSDLPQTYSMPLDSFVDHNTATHFFTRDR